MIAVISIVLLLVLLLQVPFVQNRIVQEVVGRLNENIEGAISIKKLKISFFNRIQLKDILLVGPANDTVVIAKKVDIGVKLIPLTQNSIQLKRLKLDGTGVFLENDSEDSTLNIVSMFQRDRKTPPRENDQPLDIQVARLIINDLEFQLMDRVNNGKIHLKLSALGIQPEKIDLAQKEIFVDRLRLEKFDLDITTQPKDTADLQVNKPKKPGNPLEALDWIFKLRKLNVENSRLMVSSGNIAGGKTTRVLSLEELSTELESIEAGGKQYQADLLSMTVLYNNKVDIRELGFQAKINNSNATVRNFRLQTGKSLVALDARVDYPSMERMIEDPYHSALEVKLRSESDLSELAAITERKFSKTGFPQLTLNGIVRGTIADLMIDSITGSFGEAAMLNLTGHLTGLPETDSLEGELNLRELTAYTSKLQSYLPDSLFPANLRIPDTVYVKGKVSGSSYDLTSDLSVLTSAGSLQAMIEATRDSSLQSEKFHLDLAGDKLDVGQILEMPDTIGEVTLAAQAVLETSGFKDPRLSAELDFQTLEIMKYNYSGLSITGDYKNQTAEIKSVMSDENIDYNLTGTYDGQDSVPAFNLEAKLNYLRLDKLNLAEKSTRLSLELSSRITGTDPVAMSGNANIVGLDYSTGDVGYRADSMQLEVSALRDPLKYRLELQRMYVDDTLYLHQAELKSSMTGSEMDLQYSASLEDLPGTREGLISVSGDGQLHLDQDSMIIETRPLVVNRKFGDSTWYELSASRIVYSADDQFFEVHLHGNTLGLDASANLLQEDDINTISGSADIDSLDLVLLRPFLAARVNALEGRISGHAEVNGPTSNPDIEGSVTFMETRFNPKALNTSFLLEEESVSISKGIIRFDDLTLTDNQGNNAVLKGSINLNSNASRNFDLTLKAKEFHLVNKPASMADLYYGNVYADLDGSVLGTFKNPVIELNTGFNRESRFAFIIPGAKTKTGEGIIEFVGATENDTIAPDSVRIVKELKADANMNLELAASARFSNNLTLTLVTNPVSGESLELIGNGNLSFLLDRSGNMSLTGRYEITEGIYQLKIFDLIRREFNIEEGSYLSWSGELLEAEADLAAIYEVEPQVNELMQYGGAGQQSGNYGTVPLEVVMNLTGPLLTPEISFEIRESGQPTSAGLTSALERLSANESELNKQVFSLLVFNRFITESASSSDPLSYELSNRSRQSISTLLSSQLDRFADQYVKNVELDINVDSYETGLENDVSARTDLSADVSTEIFNDRLTLEVGGSVAVEETGTSNRSLEAGDLAGDFRAEYKLSKDGVYRLNVFNRTDYENEIDGEVTKTGVSLLFNKNFTSFRELFGIDKKKEGGENEDQ